MPKTSKHPPKLKITSGPKPDMLKIKGNWQAAVKRSLAKKKPANGWPR